MLGDSISTLEGYSKPYYAAFYEGRQKFKTGVFLPEDTWWGQVIARLGGELLTNDSFSGSKVIKSVGCEIPSYACSDERTSALSDRGVHPDVIMVYMGTNDWGGGVRVTPSCEAETGDVGVFSVAYACMLEKLRENYPRAEIWCFTLAVSMQSRREDFVFPYRYGGRHIEEYCDTIRTCAKAYGCRLVDLYRVGVPYDTNDGFHPNAEGMKTLADAVLKALEKEA